MTEPRIIASFSCGMASAVATKIALNTLPNVHVMNIRIAEEHEDNRRFLADCETWFETKIEVIQNENHDGSIFSVFAEKKFITGPSFAACSKALKKEVAAAYYIDTDEVVIGFTAEEEDRANRFIDANNARRCHFPLIDAGLTKRDCMGLLDRAGIKPPAMYAMGYSNANCIGCVRGGLGYWVKIRRDFPDQFERMAAMEEMLGATMLRHRSGPDKGARMTLRELPESCGREPVSIESECSIFCEATDL